MPAEARVTKIWKQQKLFISLFLIAFGLWFFVDGKWTWPRSNERWLEHDRFEKEKRSAEWPAYAKSRGWKTDAPHKYYDKDDLLAQFLFASACGLAGATAFLYWLLQKRRVVKSDAEAVYSPTGKRVPFGSITGLGVKKWESKGYATVRYEIDGRKGAFVLDDYKFERDPIHAIFAEIKQSLEARAEPSAES
jgi:hypothetical protein